MPNLLDPEGREALRARMRGLQPDSPARWGRMNVGQMICHITDPMRIAMGEMHAADVSTFFTRNVLKRLVLTGFPPPKGKIDTFPELDQVAGGGTPPSSLEDDVDAFDEVAERFIRQAEAGKPFERNPAFGPLTARQWGRLMYVHMDFHLKQFGV